MLLVILKCESENSTKPPKLYKERCRKLLQEVCPFSGAGNPFCRSELDFPRVLVRYETGKPLKILVNPGRCYFIGSKRKRKPGPLCFNPKSKKFVPLTNTEDRGPRSRTIESADLPSLRF
ncbi:hypothetical protein TNIN_143531 [Trichonephila inaurata madagascariensis]|uniref:Uncharacterized protein n=1 Tax=Trichonephila inaurata madagascariensis TaxID=2747483 RepID=A0A8X6XFW5_9ARAC|nr:hypothetical protein TNIN_143531 [Trichonephila inaurata madagascariensis]